MKTVNKTKFWNLFTLNVAKTSGYPHAKNTCFQSRFRSYFTNYLNIIKTLCVKILLKSGGKKQTFDMCKRCDVKLSRYRPGQALGVPGA
jgi:hypothetical protein